MLELGPRDYTCFTKDCQLGPPELDRSARGGSALVVLADEAPPTLYTPVASDDPIDPTAPNSNSQEVYAQSHNDPHPFTLALGPEISHLPLPAAQSPARPVDLGLNIESRRRRRSPSTESGGSPEVGDFTANTYLSQGQASVAHPEAEDLPHQRAVPPASKRRRLMTQDMRHEFPVSTNGTSRHTNGSSSPPQKNRFTNGTNGHGSSADDVSSTYTNGHSTSKSRQRDSNFFGHDREEVTRLLIQGLEDLGYVEAAERLCQESGYRVESREVIAFRHAILEGKWSDAESLLFGRAMESDDGGVRISNGHAPGPTHLKLVEDADVEEMKFLVREQKYVELLRRNLKGQAIHVLQTELQPLNYDARRLNALSG